MMKRLHRSMFLIGILTSTITPLYAQQGQMDTTFSIGSGANNNAQRVELLHDQTIFIGGDFTQFNGTAFKRLKRLSATGSSVSGWVPHTPVTGGADGPVRSSAMQSDGKLLIGGLFNTVNGVSSKNFARLDTSGAVDTSFHIGTGFISEVTSIAISGSRIFAGGFFSSYKGVSVPGFVCLNLSGDIDTSWFKPSAFIFVDAIAPISSGHVYIGGSFTAYNGTPINKVARLHSNGTLDTSFNIGTGVTGGNVQAMCVQPDGKLIITGSFTAVNNIATGRIARINTNGSVDITFNSGAIGASSNVRAVALQNNTGHIYIGGDFTTIHGFSRPRIARLLTNGTVDTLFAVGTGTNGTVYSIRIQNDGHVLVSGNFSQYNGTTVGKIVRLFGDTSTAVLPVKLVAFEAAKVNNTIQLKWITASETNNHYFVIERSIDGANFNQIGVVKGAGTTTNMTQYVFNDQPQGPLHYYRLKQVDADGRYSFSRIVVVSETADEINKLVVFPNPAHENFTVNGIPDSGATLHDITGKTILFIERDGSYQLNKQGLYYLKSETGVVKLLIQ